MTDTLQKYGAQFQTKCIVGLLSDKPFFEQSLDVLKSDFFESDANKWLINTSIEYFSNYRQVPTLDVFKKEVDKIENNSLLRVSIIEQLKSIFVGYKIIPTDIEYIKDELLTFCKNQAIKNAILKSADLLQVGEYDKIKHIIDTAMKAGEEKNIGSIWKTELLERTTKETRRTIPTKWPMLNVLLDGGLGGGDLGCIIAPSGAGKSYILQSLGQYAVAIGMNVLHYTLELSKEYTGLRYDQITTGIQPRLIRENYDIVNEEIKMLPGELIIKYFPMKSINMNSIRAHYDKVIGTGFRPDLVILDYADLLTSVGHANAKHEEYANIYEELKQFLSEEKVPGWTASQSQRSGLDDDFIENSRIAGAYAKVMPCDVVMTLSRKSEDKVNNCARLLLTKNRYGPDGINLLADMDLSKGEIFLYDENSPEGIRIKAKMSGHQDKMKKLIGKKALEFSRNVLEEKLMSTEGE